MVAHFRSVSSIALFLFLSWHASVCFAQTSQFVKAKQIASAEVKAFSNIASFALRWVEAKHKDAKIRGETLFLNGEADLFCQFAKQNRAAIEDRAFQYIFTMVDAFRRQKQLQREGINQIRSAETDFTLADIERLLEEHHAAVDRLPLPLFENLTEEQVPKNPNSAALLKQLQNEESSEAKYLIAVIYRPGRRSFSLPRTKDRNGRPLKRQKKIDKFSFTSKLAGTYDSLDRFLSSLESIDSSQLSEPAKAMFVTYLAESRVVHQQYTELVAKPFLEAMKKEDDLQGKLAIIEVASAMTPRLVKPVMDRLDTDSLSLAIESDPVLEARINRLKTIVQSTVPVKNPITESPDSPLSVATIFEHEKGGIQDFDISPDGCHLLVRLSVGRKKQEKATIFDLDTGKSLGQVTAQPNPNVPPKSIGARQIRFWPDSDHVAAIDPKGFIVVTDLEDNVKEKIAVSPPSPYSMTRSFDGRLLVRLTFDGIAILNRGKGQTGMIPVGGVNYTSNSGGSMLFYSGRGSGFASLDDAETEQLFPWGPIFFSDSEDIHGQSLKYAKLRRFNCLLPIHKDASIVSFPWRTNSFVASSSNRGLFLNPDQSMVLQCNEYAGMIAFELPSMKEVAFYRSGGMRAIDWLDNHRVLTKERGFLGVLDLKSFTYNKLPVDFEISKHLFTRDRNRLVCFGKKAEKRVVVVIDID